MSRSLPAALVVAAISLMSPAAAPAAAPSLDAIRLPPGFRIETWVADVPKARAMALGDKGTLFVGSRDGGKVYAIRSSADGRRSVRTLVAGLNDPNGVAFRDGALYVGETHRILRYDAIEARLDRPPAPVVIAQLPREKHHGQRYLAFGPDGKLYVPIGAPCNVCDQPGYGVILRMNADGSNRETVATGVRNSVGFAWHPQTRELWFTDNGRDFLGDDAPPCELNRLPRIGANFGFPFCQGGDIADPEFGKLGRCADAVPPAQKLGPHVAPLGLRFYTGTQFPAQYRGQIFIAEHGSWNRREPIGYRISLVRVKGSDAESYETFASGWLGADGKVSGRPVDLLVMPDGSLLVSDDKAGAIYRISYRADT